MDSRHLSDNSGHDGEKLAQGKYAAQATDTVVEIGVLFGETSKILAKNAKCTVYGIDPIIPDSMNEALVGSLEQIQEVKNEFSNFIFIQDYSYNVVKEWNKPIDFIFIDGDHNYEAVKKDFDDWYPHVKLNGIIALHDSAANRDGPFYWGGPSKLADELINDDRLEILETVHTMTVFKKIK